MADPGSVDVFLDLGSGPAFLYSFLMLPTLPNAQRHLAFLI